MKVIFFLHESQSFNVLSLLNIYSVSLTLIKLLHLSRLAWGEMTKEMLNTLSPFAFSSADIIWHAIISWLVFFSVELCSWLGFQSQPFLYFMTVIIGAVVLGADGFHKWTRECRLGQKDDRCQNHYYIYDKHCKSLIILLINTDNFYCVCVIWMLKLFVIQCTSHDSTLCCSYKQKHIRLIVFRNKYAANQGNLNSVRYNKWEILLL